jgi:hypothetical protein
MEKFKMFEIKEILNFSECVTEVCLPSIKDRKFEIFNR